MKSEPRGDTWMYVSQLYHPVTNEQLVNLNQLKQKLDEKLKGGLEKYAYIVHDSDTVSEDDVKERDNIRESFYNALRSRSDAFLLKGDIQTAPVSDAEIHARIQALVDAKYPCLIIGQLKPKHLHLVLRTSSRRWLHEIANWFSGVLDTSPYLFKLYSDNRGQSRRLANALRYLVHKAHPQKFQYDYDKVVASFDYETELVAQSQIIEAHEKYDLDRNELRDYINLIADGKKTRIDFINEHSYAFYLDYRNKFDSAEIRRLSKTPIPERITGYIGSSNDNPGGLGKTALGLAIASQLAYRRFSLHFEDFPTFQHLKTENPYFHNCPASNLFEGYTGQPIMLCNDFTANTFKASFKDGLSGIKDFLDIHPFMTLRNIKGSMVMPFAYWVLLNGDESWSDFFDSLCNVYNSKDSKKNKKVARQVSQFSRRFFFYIDVDSSSHFVLYLNSRYYAVPFAQLGQEVGDTAYYQSVSLDDNGFYRAHDYSFDWTSLLTDGVLSEEDKLAILMKNVSVVVDDILSYNINGSTWNGLDIVKT